MRPHVGDGPIRHGLPESATVSLSTDGVTWSAPVSVTDRADYAMRFQNLGATAARFVKVTVDPTSGCDAGLGSAGALLNELELYSTTDSFENDPIGNRPRGWTNMTSAWTSQDIGANDSRTALRTSS